MIDKILPAFEFSNNCIFIQAFVLEINPFESVSLKGTLNHFTDVGSGFIHLILCNREQHKEPSNPIHQFFL
jgi:hypothetical protein